MAQAEPWEGLRVASGLEEKGAEGASEPRRLEDSPAGVEGAQGLGDKPERDEAGKFLKGCKGGPGNPYNRRVALYKRLLIEAVTEEDIIVIGKKLAALAREGNVAAARVLFAYVMPKDVAPDRLDVDEWKGYKAEQPMMDEMMPILKGMEPSLPLAIVREMRPELTTGKARLMGHMVKTGSMDFLRSPEEVRAVASGAPLGGKKAPGKRGKRRGKR